MVEALKKKVNLRIQEQHNKVVMGVFSCLLNTHNENCGCNYCDIVYRYDETKKAIHRVERVLDSIDEYKSLRDYTPDEMFYLSRISFLESRAKELKEEKDSLKEKALKDLL